MYRSGLLYLLLLAIPGSCKKQSESADKLYSFDLGKIILESNGTLEQIKSREFGESVMVFTPENKQYSITLSDGQDSIPWAGARYLVCEIVNNNPYSAIVFADFYRNSGESSESGIVQQGGQPAEEFSEQPRISPKIGILPYLKTKLVIPLSHLDGQEIFMKRFPRQLKGTVMGHRLDINDVGKVILRFEPVMPPEYVPNVEITALYLSDTMPAPYGKPEIPYVDEFGQWNLKDWPGKVHNTKELKDNMMALELSAREASFPDNWSRYGGWKALKFDATGFFRIHHDGRRWWFVDPEGYAFLSAGVDCIGDNADGMISGQEDLFAWLPPGDSVYQRAYRDRGDNRMLNFLRVNLIRVYGSDARAKWENITQGLLKRYRINTVANWSDLEFARKIEHPYVLNMSNFPGTEILLYRDFPDVFSEEYRQNAATFAKQLETYKNDKYLIGYFLSNEPHWAFGDNNLAFEMFAVNTQSETRKEFIRFLEKKYKDIGAFNAAWKQNLNAFEEIGRLVLKNSPSDNCWKDCNTFSGIMVDTYVQTVCSEVRKIDASHLNLGLRYAWISSDLCYRAGTWFDVFSINGYSYPGPPETSEIARRSGKPVLIGEYHFGSTDRGLPSTGIQGAENQQARGEAYRYYLEQGFSRPEVIGIHYFQWMDQPVFGRFDGENYNIGFLDICLQPYPELTNQAAASHEAMYDVATGKIRPYDSVIRKSPQIYF
jgi:hypothetical protein